MTYMISSMGRIRSFKNLNKTVYEKRLLKQGISRGFYRYVKLCTNGKYKNMLVHVGVLQSFRGDPPLMSNGKIVVNHKNLIKTDNRISNLEWVSVRDNACHGFLKKAHSSIYTGVTYNRSHKAWSSRMLINKKRLHLGTFKTEEEAAIAYKECFLKNNLSDKYVTLI